jgi:hypothetical protein
MIDIMSAQKDFTEYNCKDDVLHIIYRKTIPTYINDIADLYEGKIDNRIGINFPVDIVKKWKSINKKNEKYSINEYIDNTKYVVVYKKGDKLTKDHEMLHARYYMDKEYKENIREIWDNMNKESKKKVSIMLKKMGYPDDNEEILIDEFQAYYYTEKDNFFGKNLI